MLIKYLGHSAVYVEGKEVRFLIDPFLSGNPMATVLPDSFNRLDYIFVTHGHGDHIGDTVDIARNTGATVVCNYELSQYFSRLGLTCHAMHIGGAHTFSFGRVKMTLAVHGSDIVTPDGLEPGGMPGGFLIEVDGKKIYHAGDTGLTMDMKLLEEEEVEVSFLPIGGNFTMDIDDAVRACEFIRPNHVVPIHYNTFDLIKANPEEFVEKVQEGKVKEGYVDVIIMKPGEVHSF